MTLSSIHTTYWVAGTNCCAGVVSPTVHGRFPLLRCRYTLLWLLRAQEQPSSIDHDQAEVFRISIFTYCRCGKQLSEGAGSNPAGRLRSARGWAACPCPAGQSGGGRAVSAVIQLAMIRLAASCCAVPRSRAPRVARQPTPLAIGQDRRVLRLPAAVPPRDPPMTAFSPAV